MEVALKNRTILQGDVLEKLREIPDGSIDCVISSPPYWGLRDYGTEGQWGLEDDFHEYLVKMQFFMKQIKRVLKSTGTVWINLGDTYSGGVTHSDFSGLPKELARPWNEGHRFKSEHRKNQIQAKSRYGIPERFYAQCIDDGWLARNHIPWIKDNSMPSSVKDRFTNKWESLFFFAKEQKYYFDLDAVREKTLTETKPFNIRVRENITGHAQAKLGDLAWIASDEELRTHNKKGERKMADVEGQSTQGIHRNRIDEKSDWPEWNNKQDNTLGADGKPLANYKGFNERWKNRKWSESTQTIKNHFSNYDPDGNNLNHPHGKNPGDVFRINPRPFPEAHFATFPIDLPLKILKCACPKNGIVLDPFFGAGTVGMAAEKLGLNWMGIELKKEYIELAEKRLVPFRNQKIL